MTASELIEALREFDPDRPVVLLTKHGGNRLDLYEAAEVAEVLWHPGLLLTAVEIRA